ncbi:hypothetical protein [Nocardia stercoris]|uniref:Glycosyltransferase RgtA/B/C/D-like domain-containing protein n=1 Tax=Nocardia stercoris TaxID=2483361 RepID=A0A3M2KVY3_9NOCA|nr:hypothetical protein [Nocardia stercoris]RMI29154.1 hypothetical protein EBN03_27435 [Nocardia stercoris]
MSLARVPRVAVVAVSAILLQLVVRGWVAGSGYFYWDDLIMTGRAATSSLWSADLLWYSHDGHFMPLAYMTVWLATAIAPLRWGLAVASLVLLQAAASLAVLRLLVVMLGWRWRLSIPLGFYLAGVLTLPAFAWWSAGLNALPLQFALAWVSADALRLVRTGQRRYVVSGVVALAVALGFFEKAAVVPVVAAAVVALLARVRGEPVRRALRRGALLWAGSGVVLVMWAVCYLLVVDTTESNSGPEQATGPEHAGALLHSAISLGIVPAAVGGPWHWERWIPATPWADPPHWGVVLAWIAVAAVVALSISLRRRVIAVWVAAAAYILLTQIPVLVIRSGPGTTAELMQSLRYFADDAVVLTIAGALVLCAPARRQVPRYGRPVVAVAMSVFTLGSLWSTYGFARSWSNAPARGYLTTARAEFAHWDGDPLLQQEVPWNVLNPLAFPQNQTDRVLAPIAPPGLFARTTPRLRMLTDTGTIVDAQVWWNRGIVPGPDPDCGYRVRGPAAVELPLTGPMLMRAWTAQLNYLADREGRVAVAFEGSDEVLADVHPGLNQVFVRLLGSGSALRIRSLTPDLALCVGVGPVGVTSFDR